jgi:hypothetical protein
VPATKSSEAVVIAREHLAEAKRKLADLAALRREMDSLIGQCRRGTIAECRITEALDAGDCRPRLVHYLSKLDARGITRKIRQGKTRRRAMI